MFLNKAFFRVLKRLMFEGLAYLNLAYGICHKIVGKEYGICPNLELRSGHKGIQGIRNAEHPAALLKHALSDKLV